MKIAVGSDDKKTIRKGHFGESRFYLVFEVLNGEIKTEELRENPRDLQQNGHGKTSAILELLGDCGILMGRSMGRKSMKKIAEKNIDCIITTTEEIDQAVNKFLEGENDGYQFFDVESGSLLPCAMRWEK